MGQLKVVVGGQAGSEAKGACTAYLARDGIADGRQVTVVRVAGPNAGHTAYDGQGRKWALRQIPVAAVVDREVMLVIGAGSEIEIAVLRDEVESLEAGGIAVRDRLLIDSQATILTDEHKAVEAGTHMIGAGGLIARVAQLEGEGLVAKIGSTGKGIGAARADRLLRGANTAGQCAEELNELGYVVDTAPVLYGALQHDDSLVLIEGTQGYVLGLHAGYYPQCTSSDCRAIDFLAMAGIDPHWVDREDYEVWAVMRTYPIRVAGNSGPLEGETSWDELGFEPERTTVTQKVRRVGQWNSDWAEAAVVANGGPDVVRISLSMADYVVPSIAGEQDFAELTDQDRAELDLLVRTVEESCNGAPVALVGTGPETFLDLRKEAPRG